MSTQLLRVDTQARPIGVDRDASVIRGVIVAEEGPFRNADRGSFSKQSVRQVIKLAKSSNGLKSHLSHTDAGEPGAIMYLLGKTVGLREEVVMRNEDGEQVPRLAARGDLHFGSYAFKAPQGDLASHVMNVVDEDPEALGMSLQLDADITYPTDRNGRQKMDASPLWMPRKLAAADIVGRGEATRSMLSDSPTPESRFLEVLSQQFADCERSIVAEYLNEFVQRALDNWPTDDEPEEDAGYYVDALSRKLRLRQKQAS